MMPLQGMHIYVYLSPEGAQAIAQIFKLTAFARMGLLSNIYKQYHQSCDIMVMLLIADRHLN